MRRPPPILTRTDTPFPYPTLSHSFVYRDGKYIDASGQSFRDFLAGRLPAMPGEKPLMGDWADHLSTLFPEVRMKRFLEMRGATAGPGSRSARCRPSGSACSTTSPRSMPPGTS